MQRISEIEYIASEEEIKELIEQGYEPISDLRQAMEHNLLKDSKNIRVYIDHKRKIVDVYSQYREIPYPCLLKDGVDVAEQRVKEQTLELFGYKYQ